MAVDLEGSANMSKHMKPKGARGRANVHRLGRSYKTGGFNKIVRSAEASGKSPAAAKRIAGAAYWNKVRHHFGQHSH